MTKNAAAKNKHDAKRELGRQQKGHEEQAHHGSRREEPDRAATQLDRCYGAIGISAVAAALRYRSEAKNPAYAPVVHHMDKDTVDAA